MEWIEPNWTVGWLCGSIHSSEPQHTFVLLNLYQKQISLESCATCDPQIWDKPGEILLAVSWKEQKWDTRDLGFWLFQEPLHERGLGPLNWEGKGRLSGWLRSILIRDGCVKCKGFSFSSSLPSLTIIDSPECRCTKEIFKVLTQAVLLKFRKIPLKLSVIKGDDVWLS